MGDINYKEPGEGAIEFAKQFIDGLTREQAAPVIAALLKGELHDASDKRVKRCEWCGYYYRDKTRPNNSKTCGRTCKFAKDNLAKAIKKTDTAMLKPKKPKSFEQEMYTYYAYWLEYPFYMNEKYMLERTHRHETPFSNEKLSQIDGAIQRGYKRKGNLTPTDGSDNVYLRGLSHKRSYGELKTREMDTNKVDEYFNRKYSYYRLRMERFRAKLFSRSKKVDI